MQFMAKYSAGDLYTPEDPPKTVFVPNLSATKLADMRDFLRQKLA